MKTVFLVGIVALFLMMNTNNTDEQNNTPVNLSLLKGTWKLDLTPENKTDTNFAKMIITDVAENSISGSFYRAGVKIREGRINTQQGIIYAALVSGDNSGTYNTAFFYKEGKLYGSTHAIDKDFLAVWIATKENN